MAKSLWGKGNWQEAEPNAREATEIDSNFAMPHIVMGNIYLRRRGAKIVVREFQDFLERSIS
jgi:hypothetical protein